MGKTTNYANGRGRQVIWGLTSPQWTGPEAPPPIEYENASGSDLVEGTVVVLQADGTVTTTTTVQDTRPVGVLIDDIDAGEDGPVQWAGPVDLILVTASVTAGDYAETSGTAGYAQDGGSALRSGSFVMFTTSGTSPEGFLFGYGGNVGAGAGMVPYYIAVGETFTVPLYKQALFSEAIEVDGNLLVIGMLLGVD